MSPQTSDHVPSIPPQDVASLKSYKDFEPIFHANKIRRVRIQWVDHANCTRAFIISVPYFRKLLESERPRVTIGRAVLGVVVLSFAPGYGPVGEVVYVLDLSSFRICSYAPGHAVVFGFFQEHLPVPRPNGPSYEVPCCPRTALSRLVRYAQQELGIQFLVGVETEFILLKSTNPIVPVNIHQYGTTLAIPTGTIEAQVLDEIADALSADDVDLQMYHAEAAPGQYEVVTGPMSPLEAADALVHTRETICNIASKHELRATFAPKLAPDSGGSGAHTHVSVRSDRPDTSGSELMTSVESAFLAGLMKYLPSILALTLPLPASYDRMMDGIWSGGTWVCWGVDNREAPVRLTKPHLPSSRNFEVRPVDGASNPYLAIAGILACGVLGVRDNLTLSVRNCNGPQIAAKMTDEERAEMGITRRLPLSLAEARQYLAEDDAIKGILGVELVDNFVQISKMLEDVMNRQEGESEAQNLARLVENY